MHVLTEIETRVLGALIEKDITTPDYYPLSLNALVNACNQKNNRDPVMTLDESAVRDALATLQEKRLAGPASGATLILLAAGANVNARTRAGYTPLHFAASTGDPAVAQWLLSSHADVNAQGHHSETPLQVAAMTGHKNVAALLSQRGARE